MAEFRSAESRLVLWNANAGRAKQFDELCFRLGRQPHTTVIRTDSSSHAREEAEAAAADFDTVVAAGGDGTVNAVVNGLVAARGTGRLAILPLGTGNDLCRTLAIPLDPVEAAAAIDHGRTTRIDLVEVRTSSERIWCVNMATGGNSSRIEGCLTDELKRRWGPLCYFRGALGVVPDLIEFDVALKLDDHPPEHFQATNLIVGNGRTSGGGLEVAPRANPEDGLLEIIVISGQSTFDVVSLTARLLSGDYLDSDQVTYRQARRMEIVSDPSFDFSVDGDPMKGKRFVFETLPRALHAVVGADYSPRTTLGRASTVRFPPSQ